MNNPFSTDESGGSSASQSDSSEDEVTEHVTRSTPPAVMAAARAQVPTISVTPHSPGVLDDSLQQLRRLHAAVQRMRAAPLPLLAIGSNRLSTSCPSLCKDGAPEPDCASPTHLDFYPQSRKGSGESRQWGLWERRDEGRRSSWAALEPGARLHDSHRQRSTLNGHSASLSSMESEGEVPRPVRHSTHSLNDNDLAKDFEKVTAALRAGTTVAAAEGGRLAARLPLQKSVSTPSIVAAIQPPQPQPPIAIVSGGGASETESEEDSVPTEGSITQLPGRRLNNTRQEHLGLHRLAFLEQAAFDHHAEKRRKRGSLFFRKKKDKSRKASHAWQAAGGSGDCDWCGRALTDNPSLYCDNCTMTVHQNVCKDYIVECNKPKSSKTSVGKSLSANSGKSSKRSSVSGQSQNSTSTSHAYNDDKEGSDHKHDQSNASDDAGAAEWPEVYLTADQLGDEAAALGLGACEPDTWAAGAPKGLAKSLGERETKRQEHIYELILTEKHHCLTIRLMQKMFVEGMIRLGGVSGGQLARMFPRVEELWTLHASLLARLRARQRLAPAVATVADVLADTFAPPAHRLKAAYDESGGSSASQSDSSEDEVTEHVTRSTPPAVMAAARAQVPTISVTPHSPGVLDDSLQQLRRLHAAVQRMRAAPLPLLAIGSNRLSTSCPSLCKDGAPEPDCASPTHLDFYPQSRKGSGESRQWGLWERRDEGRRSSWAALEPGARLHDSHRQRSTLNGHSASLSSMESEGEVPRPVRHSTHSLNDNDLAKDFEKVTAALRAGTTVAAAEGGRLAARLPLQKSVSTPSIVAAIQPPQPQPPIAIVSGGGASETESEEDSVPTEGSITQLPGRRLNNTRQEHLGLHRLAFLEQAAFDHHAEKRRKRGSLFFRKKKDKSRKASHAWQAAGGSGDCDWCGRALTDNPSLYCDNCTMTVHQNVCKDYIVECNKPKSSKTSVGKSLSANSGKSSKRSSVSGQSQNSTSTSHAYNDDKEGSDHKHDQSNASDDAGAAEWPEVYLTADQLGDEAAALGLGACEPDTWAAGAPKGLAKSLGERETKRQEHIYELILTEKHHCLTIRLMQKMFVEGMIRLGGVSGGQLARMFPRVEELWTLHASLLARLRARQRLAPAVATVADVLADTFAPPAHRLKAAYGEFCSRHHEAVEVFKECCTREPRLARFIRKCQQNPMLRKKGVPECVLFVAQRLTKYPLLLEPLLKTAGDDVNERELLQRALCGVKEILVDVDNQVAAKEREDRKLEIYHRIDAKSFANFRGRKFKKSDILQGNRSLKFEGVATLMQGRSKMQTLLVIVLTDVLFFLHDNNNKYTFFTPDNKTGVVSLVKLLVREKAGAEGRGLYLICSGPAEPEMFELRVHRPKDIHAWIQAIRAAVQNCPEEEKEPDTASLAPSADERQRLLDARHENIRLITEALRAKDREHAVLLEDKMALHMKMTAHTGNYQLDVPNTGVTGATFPGGLVFPEYVRLAAPSPDTHALWQEVCRVVKEALEASSGTWSSSGSLGRSTSSAGERHSRAYESPALPRRADTFAGFDNSRHRGVPRLSTETPIEEPAEDNNELRLLEQMGGPMALRLQHAIYTLTCIVWQQLTTIHSLEAQVCAWRSSGGNAARSHDAQLEELRHAQAKLTADRASWEAMRAADRAAIALEKRQLQAAREELAEQQKDVEQQRERLYRRLERLQQHGSQEEIASVGTLSPDSTVTDTTRRKEPKWRNNRGSTGSESSQSACSVRSAALPPPQLLSAQNETRATARAPAISQMVKQQLPLKLASGKTQQQPPPGYHRLHESPSEQHQGLVVHHTRTGSSPAPLPSQQHPNNKATRTNTYPKLPDKFRVRSPESPAPQPPEEEVIYF